MTRFAVLALALAACASSPVPTTPATLSIAPDDALSKRIIGHGPLSAYARTDGDAWKIVYSNVPAGTDCTAAPVGPGALTFFVPTAPALVSNPDGTIVQPIDIAVPTTPVFPEPHAELDLVVATTETVGGLYFKQTDSGFSGRFDATSSSSGELLHVTGSFDVTICND